MLLTFSIISNIWLIFTVLLSFSIVNFPQILKLICFPIGSTRCLILSDTIPVWNTNDCYLNVQHLCKCKWFGYVWRNFLNQFKKWSLLKSYRHIGCSFCFRNKWRCFHYFPIWKDWFHSLISVNHSPLKSRRPRTS